MQRCTATWAIALCAWLSIGPTAPAAASGRPVSLLPRGLAATRTQLAPQPSPPDVFAPASEAEALFADGEAAYERADFDTAADRFARAQALAPHPATMYNLGMAQHRAGRVLEAHATFERLHAAANTPDERADAVAARQRVRRELSAVIVTVSPDVTVCLDDIAMPPPAGAGVADPESSRERLLLPGPHRLQAFGATTKLDLAPGETQRLWLQSWDQATQRRTPQRRPLTTALLALAAGGGAAAVGTGAGAAVVRDRRLARTLGLSAALAGAVALGSAVSAAVLVRRGRASTTPPKRASSCAKIDRSNPGPQT